MGSTCTPQHLALSLFVPPVHSPASLLQPRSWDQIPRNLLLSQSQPVIYWIDLWIKPYTDFQFPWEVWGWFPPSCFGISCALPAGTEKEGERNAAGITLHPSHVSRLLELCFPLRKLETSSCQAT